MEGHERLEIVVIIIMFIIIIIIIIIILLSETVAPEKGPAEYWGTWGDLQRHRKEHLVEYGGNAHPMAARSGI